MSVILLFVSILPSQADHESFYKVHNLLISAGNDPDKIQDVISVISDEIEKDPDNRDLLRLRVKIYTSTGKLHEAYKDILCLVSLKPEVSMYQYWKCIFEESFENLNKSCLQCYEKAYELAAVELGDKKDNDFGYICLLLLAENPRGQILAEKFMQTLTNSTEDQHLREMLENFDRKKFLPDYNPDSSQ
jgi:hypothetical protein